MGEALGRIYCKKFFPESSKKMMETLVKNLQISLGERIDAQTWMSDVTKAAAHKKLDKFYVKIGYPNKWTDYSLLNIDPSKSYYENVLACRKFANDKEIAEKAGKPVDRDEWYMTHQTVNAYYNPTTNEICFPAGILQYPFFDPKADEAFNYGAIGVVIGHEMTHGFDDQGRQYDATGNLQDWWTADDAKGFNQRADMYANFFSNIKVLPDLNGNGRFTPRSPSRTRTVSLQLSASSRPTQAYGDRTSPRRRYVSASRTTHTLWANGVSTEPCHISMPGMRPSV